MQANIYTVIKTTSVGDGRLSVVGVAGWAWSTHATVSASQEHTLSGRGARVYTCTCVHDNIRVDVYRSRPIGASLLSTSPEGPARRVWLGIVTGIHLIHIIAAATAERRGGFLVRITNATQFLLISIMF